MTEPTDEQKRQELAEAGSLEDLLLKTAARLQADHAGQVARAAMVTKRYLVTRKATMDFEVEARDEREATEIVDDLIFTDENNAFSMSTYDSEVITLVSDDDEHWEALNS